MSFIQVQLNFQVRDCVGCAEGITIRRRQKENRHDEEMVLHVTTMFIQNYL